MRAFFVAAAIMAIGCLGFVGEAKAFHGRVRPCCGPYGVAYYPPAVPVYAPAYPVAYYPPVAPAYYVSPYAIVPTAVPVVSYYPYYTGFYYAY